MTGALTLGAALLLGMPASGHCFVMCGGISAALGIVTAKRADGRPRPKLLIGYQLGRIASYTLAGLLLGGALGGLIALLDIETVRRSLRALSALALLLGALVAFGAVRDPSFGIGRRLWSRLAPLGRKLLPVTHLPSASAFGLGTLPGMLLAAFGAQRFAGFSGRPAARRIAGAALLASAALTLTAPWLLSGAPWLHAWLPFECVVH